MTTGLAGGQDYLGRGLMRLQCEVAPFDQRGALAG
jgi:hypothetical protein